MVTAAAPLACLIIIDRDADRETVVAPLSGVDALESLQALAMNAGPAALLALLRTVSSAPIYRLRSRNPDEAMAEIEVMASSKSDSAEANRPPRITNYCES